MVPSIVAHQRPRNQIPASDSNQLSKTMRNLLHGSRREGSRGDGRVEAEAPIVPVTLLLTGSETGPSHPVRTLRFGTAGQDHA